MPTPGDQALLQVFIKLRDEFSKEYEALSKRTVQQANQTARQTRTAFSSIARYIRAGFAPLKTVGSTIAAVGRRLFNLKNLLAAALGGLGVKEMAALGGKMEGLEKAFGTLAASADVAGKDILAAMQRGLRGTVSEIDVLEQANRALVLRVAETPEQFELMAVGARRLAQAMGIDMAYALNSVTTGIARQSVNWLDNIGVIVKAEEAYKRFADSLGKTADELTDIERREAYKAAVWDAMRKSMTRLGEDTATNAEKLGRLYAELKNTAVEISTNLLPAIASIGEALGTLVQSPAFKAAIGGLKDVGDAVNDIAEAAKKTGTPAKTIMTILEGFAEATRKAAEYRKEVEKVQEILSRPMPTHADIDAFFEAHKRRYFPARSFEGLDIKQQREILRELMGITKDFMAIQEEVITATADVSAGNIFGGLSAQGFQEYVAGVQQAIDAEYHFLDVMRTANMELTAQASWSTKVWRGMAEGAMAYFDRIKNTAANAAEAVGSVFRGLEDSLGAVFFDGLTNKFRNLKDVIRGFLEDTERALTKFLAQELIRSLIGSAIGSIGGALGLGGPGMGLPWAEHAQHGGPLWPNKAYFVGEQGPELFVPPAAGNLIPNYAMGGGGGGVEIHNHITIHAQDAVDVKRSLQKVMPWLAQQQQRFIHTDPHSRAFYRGLRR